MKTFFSCTIIVILLSACSSIKETRHKNWNGDMPYKPGSCFAKCLMPDITEENIVAELPIYTGEDLNPDFELETVSFVSQPASTKWVKKKADKNCLSANPEDCLVWCLVEVPEESVQYKVVSDTTATKQWEMTHITETNLLRRGGHTEWIEVVCDNDRTTDLISDLQNKLIEHGFFTGDVDGEFSNETKNALANFQEENQLPKGQLDFQSLDVLGVEY